MNLLFKNATIIDEHSQYNNKTVDVKVEAGIITQIGHNSITEPHMEVIELENLHISRGWFDSSVSFGEPGYEDRETLANGLNTAALSGFTNVAVQPNGNPIADTQADIHFISGKAANTATSVHPIGALTKGSVGNDIAELFDMKNAGAVAFGDYNKAVADANILKIALQYVQDFDGLVIAYAQDDKIKGKGVVHEGTVSTRLGLKGIPALAEELQIARNLFLLEYTGGKMHIPTISTAKSVQLIKEAKVKGLNVTCSVAVHHLVLTDAVLTDFDTCYKITPPLRPEADRQALIAGVLDGTIDIITSDHNPIDIENKKMEFDLAKDGTIGLESAFGALLTVLPLETVIKKLTAGKKLFGIEDHVIAEGKPASFTLFNPDVKYTFGKQNILSKSKNSAFLGMELQGKAYGTCNNGKLMLKK
ncbi:dihydroorotase [Flavobacterium salilacus subsp. salilacus]|uniref:dihydroorotase n=1 Tax=Flavobacterium TaxID=237 RepID=UPI001074BF90|nr:MULTISPECIES: dihydroorotase [Flavobacterium]KAF2518678.1 dihydroorotase [Flavobacterium salilacus subsp. salilacus]MBE1613641.1 dihydroorotase [Flavobacterium sp. SaA2.13]